MSNCVVIFRLQLFKASETFISSQVKCLVRYTPTYVGRSVVGGGSGGDFLVPYAPSRLLRFLTALRISGFRDIRPFIALLVSRPPDVLHAHFGVDGVIALPLAKKFNIPLITTLHGFDVTRSDWNMLLSGSPALINGVLFRRQLQQQGDLFLCVSEFIKKAAIARGYPENRLLVHYIGIDTAKIKPRHHAGEDGLIVHVGRLVEKKGTIYLLRAFVQVSKNHPEARLIIIGDGPLRSSLESEAKILGVSEKVKFLGALSNEEVLAWDARAAIKVVPSVTAEDGDSEGLPTVITETQAQAVPVVAFDSGGINEAVLHGETGLLSPERDVEGLAKNISLLLSDPALRTRFGLAARKRVEELFDIHKQTSKLEDIYDAVIARRIPS